MPQKMKPAASTEGRAQRRIGKYLITGRIGRGGMGMVYRGYDEVLEREVAVKILTVEGSEDDEHRRRFEIEAKAAAKLQHPNIVTVFELGEDRGIPFIAMELLPGADLESLLRSGENLLLQEKLDIMTQVCRGLQYAHEHRVIHRDVKPSNIRVLEDGSAKIMDFGIAKLGQTGVTKSGMMVGTVHYMSPEQIRGRPLDGRNDVFSSGVILYELLAGRRPFVGEGPTQILYRIVHDDPPPIEGELGECGERLRAVVARSLAKDPEQRYRSAAALADDLTGVARSLSPAGSAVLPHEAMESVALSRRLLKEGRLEEGVQRLSEVTELHPQLVEARRALRWAKREFASQTAPPSPEQDGFPELEATFQAQAPATQVEAETVLQPTVLAAPSDRPPAAKRIAPRPLPPKPAVGGVLAVGAAAAVVALSIGGYLWLRAPEPRPSPGPVASASPSASPLAAPSPTETARRLAISSDPKGAAVTLDGRPAGVTPLEVWLDLEPPHRVVVAKAGYLSQETRLVPGAWPAEIKLVLEPEGPLGKVAVASPYPLDVQWRGKVLARAATGAEVLVPAGRQTLTLVSAAHFLRAEVTVEVRAGETAEVSAPQLGTLNVRANPDNCQVFIDGTFVDYPPILDRSLAAGSHRVRFEWPDGLRREESVQVSAGSPAYVMGRKDEQ